ncbi:acyl-CoA synthetase (NDP forming) [Natronocella acetinitrilica]|uniref:Acyl-CoA synthetase (NDP forming) n=1 Tax=Natronocella acetinitrilica TaxID=414046 RepID=A0AAE3G831_9GAMM|nr:acyl-CoA synthetase (NDP forming) [Natronocella acetinitrilica]
MLTEVEAKALLRQYRIQTTAPMLATSAEQADQACKTFNRPVVMKVVSADVAHKARVGGVRVGIDPADASGIFEEIMSAVRAAEPNAKLEGVLIEEVVEGHLEVFIGARVDREYGSIVMLGRGGSGVEAGAPPVTALAPLSPESADGLLTQAFGTSADGVLDQTARSTLHRYLLAVAGAEGLLFREDISDLDINPLLVGEKEVVAVDAVAELLSPGERFGRLDADTVSQEKAGRVQRLQRMRALFEPEAIAFIGASTSPSKLGYRNIKNLVDFGFRGRVYPIHPKAAEICGVQAYPSIGDVPGPVDRAYIALSAAQVPQALEDCVKKGVDVVQVLSAGFSEWVPKGERGEPAEDPDAVLRAAIKGSGTRVVGPNCIGTFSSRARLAMGAARYCPTDSGSITFISQSGTFAGDVVRRAQALGLPVGQVLSCGNCLDLDLIDYLLFCEADTNTKLIAIYAESIRNAGLFFRLAAQSSKPIVIFRGGLTDQGGAAASSHTAALATDTVLWEAAVRASGVLQVGTLDDLLDVLVAFSGHDTLTGKRLAIFGSGGGVSVTSSDAAEQVDLELATLNSMTRSELEGFAGPGTSVSNPIDIPVWGLKRGDDFVLGEILDHLKADDGIDAIVAYVEMGTVMDFSDADEEGLAQLQAICDSILATATSGAAVSLVLRSTGDKVQDDFVRAQRPVFIRRGISLYSSTARAVRAIGRLRAMSRGVASRSVDIKNG